MPTPFPPRANLIPAGALTPANFKVELAAFYDAVVALLGTDGELATARAALGAAKAGVDDTITALSVQTQFRGLDRTQTVLSGPVDSSGYSAFGGSTGTDTLTTTATLRVAAAAGGDLSYVGAIVNPAFTSPAGTGTAFLSVSVTSAGVATASVRSLQRVEQWGGSYSTTNGQLTFNIQEMTHKVGNGATADQVYEVVIGECAHTAGVWSGSPTWYALKGRYDSGLFLTAVSTAYTKTHNIGSLTGLRSEISWADDAAGTNERPAAGFTGNNGASFGAQTRNACTVVTGASNVAYSTANPAIAIASAYYRIKSWRPW